MGFTDDVKALERERAGDSGRADAWARSGVAPQDPRQISLKSVLKYVREALPWLPFPTTQRYVTGVDPDGVVRVAVARVGELVDSTRPMVRGICGHYQPRSEYGRSTRWVVLADGRVFCEDPRCPGLLEALKQQLPALVVQS
ncbi:MAG: hypothetical protein LBV00_02945 [Propionibacteriaceae bacterium]|jgi:hypothetical protein|nr:hypothetical protein [Propionibacteriaceae bacterium]